MLKGSIDPLAPTSRSDRLELLDILRGIAIIGILFTNFSWFARPMMSGFLQIPWGDGLFPQIYEYVWQFLIHGKFFTMFCLLFGVGIGLQLKRAQSTTRSPFSYIRRRLLILLLFGLLHAHFLWLGDIRSRLKFGAHLLALHGLLIDNSGGLVRGE